MQIRFGRIPQRVLVITLFFALFLLMVLEVNTTLKEPLEREWYPGITEFQIGVDWKGGFRPAVLALLSGKSPYTYTVFNPPWAFLPLIPFALLPARLGTAAIFVLGLFLPAWAAARMGAKPLAAAAFVLTPFVIVNAQNGNIDWMVLLGATLPPQIGLFLVLAKPQIGIGIILFWLLEAWDQGKLLRVVKVFGPVGITLLLSFLVYGPYMFRNSTTAVSHPLNTSIWPIGLMVGVPLLN